MGNQTKFVNIVLSALTRVEYTEVIEVPADISPDELDRLVDQRYDQVDGGAYLPDPECWQKGLSCRHEEADINDQYQATLRATRVYGFPGAAFAIVKRDSAGASEVLPSMEAISVTFSKLLREKLTPEQMDAINASNKAGGYSDSVCASHDHCDANVVMTEAFATFGISQDRIIDGDGIQSAELLNLWNSAWCLSKKNHFLVTETEPG